MSTNNSAVVTTISEPWTAEGAMVDANVAWAAVERTMALAATSAVADTSTTVRDKYGRLISR